MRTRRGKLSKEEVEEVVQSVNTKLGKKPDKDAAKKDKKNAPKKPSKKDKSKKGPKEMPESDVVLEEAPVDDGSETSTNDDVRKALDDLKQEMGQVTADGKIEAQEVMGLLDNLVMMVNMLLRAKPGRVRKSSVGRERVIAGRVARRCLR